MSKSVDRRIVRLMSDYWADWPLWDNGGETTPENLGLSDQLAERLGDWQQTFNRSFSHDEGWRSSADAAWYAQEGPNLHRALTSEIGRWAEVVLDLWPISGS